MFSKLALPFALLSVIFVTQLNGVPIPIYGQSGFGRNISNTMDGWWSGNEQHTSGNWWDAYARPVIHMGVHGGAGVAKWVTRNPGYQQEYKRVGDHWELFNDRGR